MQIQLQRRTADKSCSLEIRVVTATKQHGFGTLQAAKNSLGDSQGLGHGHYHYHYHHHHHCHWRRGVSDATLTKCDKLRNYF